MIRFPRRRSSAAGLAAALLAATTAAPAAFGEDSATGDWRFRVTPYLWAPTLYGTTAVQPSQPEAESDGYNLLDALDFAVLVAGEARHGDFFLLGEANYIKLSDDGASIRNRVTASAEVSLDVFETALSAGHRIHTTDSFAVDLFGGLRYWHIDGEVEFGLAGPLGLNVAQRFDGSASWVDPIVGARVEAPLGGSWYAGLLGNIGGFGIGSDLQWELIGKAGYRFDDTWALSGGYRHLAVDFDDDGFLLDATLSGPFVALDVSF
jgi:hypothetical protein